MSLKAHGEDDQVFRSLSPDFSAYLSESALVSTWEAGFRSDHSISSAQQVDQTTYLPDDILVKLDRASMAVSLEAREPLLDHRLAEYVNSLPSQYKIRGGHTKIVFKTAMHRHLPSEVVSRRKKGFSIPLRKWLCGPLADHLHSSVEGESSGIFASEQIRVLLRALREGKRDISSQVWKLMVLAVWAGSQKATNKWQ
jgi:asparagine synthase (glutamine-hydrolysing)